MPSFPSASRSRRTVAINEGTPTNEFMTPTTNSLPKTVRRAKTRFATLLGVLLSAAASGQVFVLSAGGGADGVVGTYTTQGQALNAALITGLANAQDLAVSDNGNLLVLSAYSGAAGGSVGEYTALGKTVNPALISGLPIAGGLALDGNGHIFVAMSGPGGPVAEYTTSGALVTPSLIPVLNWPLGIACDRNGHV